MWSEASKRRVLRVALWSLAASAAFTGVPAAFAPRAFYDSFPAGLSWVSKLPPYNQHLVGDVGGFYLGFTFLFVWCALTLRRAAIVPIMLAWIGVEAFHTAYHVTHLENFSAGDAIAETASFAILLALPCLALALSAERPARAARSS
jgi:hypothetical protein